MEYIVLSYFFQIIFSLSAVFIDTICGIHSIVILFFRLYFVCQKYLLIPYLEYTVLSYYFQTIFSLLAVFIDTKCGKHSIVILFSDYI